MHQSQISEIFISSAVMRTINQLPATMRGTVVSGIRNRLFGEAAPAAMTGMEAAACAMICDTIMRESYRHANM